MTSENDPIRVRVQLDCKVPYVDIKPMVESKYGDDEWEEETGHLAEQAVLDDLYAYFETADIVDVDAS